MILQETDVLDTTIHTQGSLIVSIKRRSHARNVCIVNTVKQKTQKEMYIEGKILRLKNGIRMINDCLQSCGVKNEL